eukprot:CAMPEP_0196659572 /NCGR_PEP_ID=MMETSP1086-20130531/35683_1 /TAXON_ID=77921 /ORGANISM="Cyanoptyche  gloeocystis , Strain SAG4.97" /LENGTH=42 /DNA_ID= /DNA_START= /DNA_END= /DNA_ORIENTATION=
MTKRDRDIMNVSWQHEAITKRGITWPRHNVTVTSWMSRGHDR